MAYNGFPYQPMGYQQQLGQMQPQGQQPGQGSPQSPIIWVSGETGAKAYMLAPNTTLPLWDSENQVIYLKSTDASGMPSMKILDYTIRNNTPPIQEKEPEANTDYVTHEEFKKFERSIRNQINKLKKEEKDEQSS
jgi:hypothetical protein